MKSAEKLKSFMESEQVYRRHELEKVSTAVDRDLKTLIESGEIKKLRAGLYYRPVKNAYGFIPPTGKELVKAFLKTDDFLLTSYNNYNQLGLGLTQTYNQYLVYNHKRFGEYLIGNKKFKFRQLPAYPKKISKEYLLVDLLNNLNQLPDNIENVYQNLNSKLSEFDSKAVLDNAIKYGRPKTQTILKSLYT